MEYLVGTVCGLAVGLIGTLSGMDRDGAFYPTVLIVIAAYYVLFAALEPSFPVVAFEVAVAIGFSVAAIVGFRKTLWVVVVALVAHGLFDLGHALFVDNPAVPTWWPGFCAAVDLFAGAWLAASLMIRSTSTQASSS